MCEELLPAPAFEPVEAFSLAEMLCDEMQARGWTTDDVAVRMQDAPIDPKQLGMDMLALSLLLSVQEDSLLVGDRMFAALARAFDVSEQFFRNIDNCWRTYPNRRATFEAPESIYGPVTTSGFKKRRLAT